MIDKFLSLSFLFAPLFYITRMSLPKAEQIFFGFFTAILFILSTFQSPRRAVSIFPFIVLLSVAVAQLFFYEFSPTSAHCVTNIFLGVIAVYLISKYSDGINKNMLAMIVVGGALNIVMVLCENFGISPIIHNVGANNTTNLINGGFMGNAPRLGDYLALTLPMAFAYSWIAGALWLLAGLYIHQYPVFLVFGVFAFLCLKNNIYKITPWVFLGYIVLFSMLHHQHIQQSLTIRFSQWQPLIEQIFQHPVFGLGIGTYQLFTNSVDAVALSSWLEFLFNFGLIAGGVVIYFFAEDFVKNYRISLINTSIICLSVLCLIEYPFEIPRFWPLLVAMGGFYLIEKTGESYVK